MADSIKPNSTDQKRKSSIRPGGKDKDSSSRAKDDGFDSLQKELLLRARKRAEAASSHPAPPVAVDDYVPATPTRIGQPAFQEMDSDFTNGERRREAEQADTVPSFPVLSDPPSEPKVTAADSETKRERKTPEVVLRAEVVVADVEERDAEAEREGPERRESRRVTLRDSSVPAPTEEDEAIGSDDSTDIDDSKGSSEDGYIQSEAIEFDEFTADGPLITSSYGPNGQKPTPAPDLYELIPTMNASADHAEPSLSDLNLEPDANQPRRSKKSMILGLASAALVLIAVAGLFIIPKWETPRIAEQPKQQSDIQNTSTSSTTPAVPQTQVTSNPEGAELIHEGAVVGNTPIKVERPTYEQIFLLRFPGYESQLLRISPTSAETIHVTLQPSNNAINQQP